MIVTLYRCVSFVFALYLSLYFVSDKRPLVFFGEDYSMPTIQSIKHKKLKRKQLILAIAASLGISQVAQAQFTNPLQLSDINGVNGFVIYGVDTGDRSGASVSSAGDINGDGIDDLLIGAYRASPNGNSDAGSTYVVYGSSTGLPDLLQLSNLNGSNGFSIHGEITGDRSGISVSPAGDINGDGIDDLLIGAEEASPNGNLYAGSTYVVFGSSKGLDNPLNLSSLNGSDGFAIHGENAVDYSGRSVSSAGDINGDGVDDLLIGATYTDSDDGSAEARGSTYVVFGNSTGLPDPLNLSSLNGVNGFTIHGENAFDQSGTSVSSAGDINDDGIDDLLIGATGADPNDNLAAGNTYVIFGSSTGFANPLNLSSLNGSNGFVIHGENNVDLSGTSVNSAGDINGDGIDDLLIGAIGAGPNDNLRAGNTYVVFGSSTGFANPLNLSSLNGSNGFVIHGENAFDQSGRSVSAAGDINGDGMDDLLIGAAYADPNNNLAAGSTYVVFGSSTGFANPLNLSNLNGSNGFVIHGENANDTSGTSVSAAGDINSDGVDDLLIGASSASPNNNTFSGSTYVIFGRDYDLIFKNSFEN